MRTITTRIRRTLGVVALVALVALGQTAPAAAQQGSVPDVRGTYLLDGAYTLFDCNVDTTGIPETTFPLSLSLVIQNQDGASFTGYLAYPEQQTEVFTIAGRVSSEGLVEGTWQFADGQPIEYRDQVFTGEIADGKAAIELSATAAVDTVSCRFRIALSSEAVLLSWVAPDAPTAETPLPPPRQLQALDFASPQKAEAGKATGAGTPTGYNVYRSKTPNVETSEENLFTSVPATVTSVPAPDGSDGSFFVVTATYPDGESGPSNEVSGGVPAATLANVTVKGSKIVAKGTDFSNPVQVLVDGIPFAQPAKVKGGTKVAQKGALLTGESIPEYITPGRTVTITFRNANGGVATKVYTKP